MRGAVRGAVRRAVRGAVHGAVRGVVRGGCCVGEVRSNPQGLQTPRVRTKARVGAIAQ